MTYTDLLNSLMMFVLLAVPYAGCSRNDYSVKSPTAFSTQVKSLLSECKGDIKVPESVLIAYASFIETAKVATEANLATHCATGAVRISTDRRPQNPWLGQDMNVHFLRSGEFQANILQVQQLDGQGYFFRTGSSGLSFIQTDSGIWKINDYFDKPID